MPRSELDESAPRAADLGIYKICRAGDLVLNRMSAYKGAIGVAPVSGLVSPDYLVMRTTKIASPWFLAYLIKTPWFVGRMTQLLRGIGSFEGSGVRTPRIGVEELGSIMVDVPDRESQDAIVGYLDRETAQIDAFIADQEALIELLTERRAATITHAVTKGLDSSVPMKSSGLDTAEQIPASWEVWPFNRYAPHRVDYRGATPTKVSDGVLLITARNVKAGYIDYESSAEYVAAESYADTMRRGMPRLGDVLLTMEAPLGNVALVDRTDIALAQRLVKFRVKAGADPRFAVFAMISSYFQQQLLSRATGSTALGIKASKLSELRIAVPSDSEQIAIADHLDRETAEIDATISDAREVIALSKERRAALISAAVTGKIDVRGWRDAS